MDDSRREDDFGIPSDRVVAVVATLDDGQQQVGSGFLVAERLVITVEHCIRNKAAPHAPATSLRIVRLPGAAEAAAEVLCVDGVRAASQTLDVALLEINDKSWLSYPTVPFARVNRRLITELYPCDAVGFPLWQSDPKGNIRNPVHVRGYIRPADDSNSRPPRLVLRDQTLETVHVTVSGSMIRATSDYRVSAIRSVWGGISGALTFHRGFAIGLVIEHNPQQGSSSLRIRPLDALSQYAGDDEGARKIADRLSLADIVDLPSEWEKQLEDVGLYMWRDADFHAGLLTANDTEDVPSIEPGESVDAALLREGRLPNLQRDFSTLVPMFDQWLRSQQRKRGGERFRVLWLVGDAGPHRSKGLLACLSRAGINGRVIYDAHTDLVLGAKALRHAMAASRLPAATLISVDLEEHQLSEAWKEVRNAIAQGRKQHSTEPDPYPRLIVGGTVEQLQQAFMVLKDVEITSIDPRGRTGPRPGADLISPDPSYEPRLFHEHVFNRGLPITTRTLFGREDELNCLRRAWTSDLIRIVPVVAYGGMGKSALINTWLREMRNKEYFGAQKVLAWSFYSQGTKENLVSADPFVSFALSWLGDDDSIALNPVARGVRLAELIKEQKFLLVLDGMEPLQYPLEAPDVGGQLTDDSIRSLLEELAKPDWKGLCVVTTRVPVTDLYRFERQGDALGTVVPLPLGNLDQRDAADLLRYLTGSEATFTELKGVAREVGGHALAITLLGNYIRDVHGGDLSGRFDLEKLTVEAREGGHAKRIMASYVRWLKQHHRFAELAILNLIGLFDRPARPEAMAALVKDTGVDAFITELDHVGGDIWNRCVDALRRMGLLNREIPDQPGTLDAHPLVREHFRDQLQSNDGDKWQTGNRILFDYYQKLAPEEQPSDSEGMSALYAAVTHGCAAELHQDVFEEVLLKRVWRDRRTNYSTRQLGMTGSDLVALSNYFQHRRWTELKDRNLSPRARVLVLTNAGVRLRQLGRLVDARQCFSAVVREIDPETVDPEELEDASYAAAQNCELLVIGGQLVGSSERKSDNALSSGERAVAYADRGRDPYFRMHARSSLAEVHFMLGDFNRAEVLFEAAREIDRERNPRPPFLYSQSLFRYGYYLIETNRAEKLLDDEARNADWGTNREDSSRLSKAIRLLVQGAARRALIERGGEVRGLVVQAQRILDDSVIMFRSAGYADYLVRGLLERAHFYRIRRRTEDYAKTLEDLSSAAFEAKRGQMDLLYADVLLQRLACQLEFWPRMTNPERVVVRTQVSSTLDEAENRVRTLRYGRRQDMLGRLRRDWLEEGNVT